MAPPAQQGDESMRSKGLLPAVGVGAAVYFVTGVVSVSTLGLVGIGAGVGYGVGSWIADKYYAEQDKKAGHNPQETFAKMSPTLQTAISRWQAFLAQRVPGRQPTHAEAEALFTEFVQVDPFHAHQVREFVHAHGGSTAGPPAGGAGAVPVMKMTQGGAVPVQVAEV